MAANGIKLIFGGAAFIKGVTLEGVTEWLRTLENLNITGIDTAQGYGASEELLGKAGAPSRFTIDTKQSSGFGGPPSTKEWVVESGKASLEKLRTDSVDVYYLHAPDRRVPLKETLSGIDELYRQGAFRRFGISNFLAEEVEEIISIAKENGFVLPTVYQGNYNAVARRVDDEVFPVLRKHNISFYAYSPIAGGFLSKSKADLIDPEGRFGDKNNALNAIYDGMYNRPSFVAALDTWEQIAKDEGVSRAELAYRWVVYHSKLQADLGDAIIVGARTGQQLSETVAAIGKGSLSDAAVKKIDQVWESVKAEASLDNFEPYGRS
ncbi:hypothetical protein NEMBOFW57_003715 [Staphylotrichum longicolle]|uniref:NADP-dependent oxidoreductase domain-containing protein n=1 Tax=Staphylotrichum longicolle TaxID=669026 RepID=A0AAD4F6R7_9PEZI|nr:hypothetical protein NEMBOFW57_003715 [Staphylotrichum longicolle]